MAYIGSGTVTKPHPHITYTEKSRIKSRSYDESLPVAKFLEIDVWFLFYFVLVIYSGIVTVASDEDPGSILTVTYLDRKFFLYVVCEVITSSIHRQVFGMPCVHDGPKLVIFNAPN